MLHIPRNTELRSLADRIMLLAEEHDLPLTPRVYEVMFNYLTLDDSGFRDAVGTALSGAAETREDALNMAYLTFLGNATVEEGLERVRNHLARELAEVSDRISDGMRGNARLIKKLQDSLRDLADSKTRERVQSVARDMTSTGKTQLSETTLLSDRLNRTQFQLNRMQRELQELRETASTDHLTQLANRRIMDQRLDQLLSKDHSFCFALIDIDHFKRVNDNWGHSVGDTVLQGLGQYLRENLKGRDFAARVGGEEFVIFLPDTPLAGAQALCETLRAGFGDIHWVNQQTREEVGPVTLSIGVTERKFDDTPESILHRADTMLYKAKNQGRNQVVAA